MNRKDIDIYKTKKSSRHHYIPQFLINGFTNTNKQVYVYDKTKDIILTDPKSSKAIFFERDRNTIDLPDNKQSSILEDELFRFIDEQGNTIVKYLQNTVISQIEFSPERKLELMCFIIALFWRIPFTDNAVADLVQRATITSDGVNPETLKNDDNFIKSQRGSIILQTIYELEKNNRFQKKVDRIYEMPNSIFVLGDNPILFRERSNRLQQFSDNDLLIPLTSTRIYASTNKPFTAFKHTNAFTYNAAIINQSLKYVCSGNLDSLKESVTIYKEFCKKNLAYKLSKYPFTEI